MTEFSMDGLLITEDEWISTEGFMDSVGKAVSGAWGAIVKLAKGLLTKIIEFLGVVKRTLTTILGKIKKAITGVIAWIGDKLQLFYTDLKGLYEKLRSGMGWVASKVKSGASAVASGISGAALGGIEKISQAAQIISTKYSSLKTLLSEKKTVAVSAAKQKIGVLVASLKKMMDHIKELMAKAKGFEISKTKPVQALIGGCRAFLGLGGRFFRFVKWQVVHFFSRFRKTAPDDSEAEAEEI